MARVARPLRPQADPQTSACACGSLRFASRLNSNTRLPNCRTPAIRLRRCCGFGKQGEKLRESLGPVREFDVWIGKLLALRTSLSEKTDYVPRSTRECIRQIERLEERLNKKRRSAGEKLIREIEKRRDDLVEAGDAVDEAAGERSHEMDPNFAPVILREFAIVAADFPAFDEENLHDFRKRIKKVRYLAEIHGAERGRANGLRRS